MPPTDHMYELLHEAMTTVAERGDSYGTPIDDFERIAAMWNVLCPQRSMYEPHDVAMYMICLKLSRLTHSPHLKDNWLDIAGYAACGYACVVRDEEEEIAEPLEVFIGEDTIIEKVTT